VAHVQQGLSVAGGALGFYQLGLATDKRCSLGIKIGIFFCMKPLSSTSTVILTLVLLSFLLLGWITYVVLLSIPHIASLHPLSDLQGLGQLGDFIGGTLNPAIGAMTVIGLAITIYYQREQLVDAKETNSQLLRLTLESNKTSISGAKLAAIVHVIEDRVKRADSAMKQHSIVVDAKKKNEAQQGGPFDAHFLNQ
jgi:hypothetical protein